MKRFLVVSMFLIAIMSFAMPVSAKTMKNDKKAIEKTVNKYFELKYESYGKLKMKKIFDKLFVEGKGKDEEKMIVDTTIEFRKMQIEDLTFDNYKLSLDINVLDLENNEARVEVYESSVINYNGFPGVNSEIEGLFNEIELVKVDGKWLIKSVEYEDIIRDELEDYSEQLIADTSKRTAIYTESIETNGDLKEAAQNKLLTDAKNDVDNYKKEIQDAENGIVNDDAINFKASRAALKSYNRSKAVSYARNNVGKSVISGFANFESMGGDCTNFVSACLFNGGIPMDRTGSNQWYYTSMSKRAPSWTGAEYLRRYLVGNNSSSSTSNTGLYAGRTTLSSVREGDVVQNSKTNPGHSMFITKATKITGSAYKNHLICQRSTTKQGRQKDVPLSSKGLVSPGCYKIYGYY